MTGPLNSASIGENIKRCRIDLEMTQAQLAQALHVTQSAVSQWEKNLTRPDTNQMVQLASLFSVTIDALLGGSEPTASRQRPIVTDSDIKFALFGGEKGITDAQYEEVKRFAAYVRDRDK